MNGVTHEPSLTVGLLPRHQPSRTQHAAESRGDLYAFINHQTEVTGRDQWN